MYSIKMRASHEDIHISGAETMCEFEDLENYLKKNILIKHLIMKMEI